MITLDVSVRISVTMRPVKYHLSWYKILTIHGGIHRQILGVEKLPRGLKGGLEHSYFVTKCSTKLPMVICTNTGKRVDTEHPEAGCLESLLLCRQT